MSRPATPTVHNVLLAANAKDAADAVRRDPSLASCAVITRESQLYGIWISEWHITDMAARNMRDLGRMTTYLRHRAALTEAMLKANTTRRTR